MAIGKSIVNRILGFFTDFIVAPYNPSTENSIMAYIRTLYYHVHGASFLYPNKSDPITITANAASWNATGTIVEIIPANTITKTFDLHWISISDISENCYGVIDLFSGTAGNEVLIGSVDLSRTAVFTTEGNKRVQVPQQVANTRISARLSTSTTNATTCKVKLYGHVYSNSLT